jgi:AcrR family transcriptional regulator
VSITPPRRLGRPPAIDSAETRQRILEAARHAFARFGFDAATNKDIAEEVGITTGAIYHYFESKADLYIEVFKEVQDLVYGAFETVAVEQISLRDRLVAILDMSVELNRGDTSIAGFVVGVALEADRHPDLATRLAEVRRGASGFFRSMVQSAIDSGELERSTDVQTTVDMILAVTTGLARFSATVNDLDRHRRVTVMVERMIRGDLFMPVLPAPTAAR